MPKKIRELKAMLKKAGFRWRPGKGNQTVWEHPAHPKISVTMAGNDAKRYQEKEVEQAIEGVEEQP